MRRYCTDDSGYWPAQYIGKDGAYKIVQTNTNGESAYARGYLVIRHTCIFANCLSAL